MVTNNELAESLGVTYTYRLTLQDPKTKCEQYTDPICVDIPVGDKNNNVMKTGGMFDHLTVINSSGNKFDTGDTSIVVEIFGIWEIKQGWDSVKGGKRYYGCLQAKNINLINP